MRFRRIMDDSQQTQTKSEIGTKFYRWRIIQSVEDKIL